MQLKRYKHVSGITLGLLLCGFTVTGAADVYRWLDAGGGNHYTDRTHENSKKIQVKPGYAFFKVDRVYDGDTVRLEGGRKIRLLGVNTPEVKHRSQATEAGGEAAKRWLAAKLQNQKVRLVTDVEQTDKYKRTLAHVFNENNEHINLQLVELGLAAVNIYPPNLLYSAQLTEAGAKAELARRGIWREPDYTAIPVEKIGKESHSGWLRITGTVIDIRSSRKYVYLSFPGSIQARIEKKWLTLFPDIVTYRGKTVEARGWLNKNRGGWSMLVRHPSALIFL